MKSCYTEVFDPPALAIVDLSEPNAFVPGYTYIHRINVPPQHRRKGVARRLMARVLHDAYIEGVKLAVEINSSDGMSWLQLEAWYERLGFEWRDIIIVTTTCTMMVREPYPHVS